MFSMSKKCLIFALNYRMSKNPQRMVLKTCA